MSTTSPCVHGSPLGSCFFCQHTKPIYPDLYSSIPAQPLAADTSPTGWDAGYETLKVLPGDVLTAHEYLARCKEIPAQPASTLDTSPPSRTSNAASANGAASFLTDIVASNIEDLLHSVNKHLEADWLVADKKAIARIKRIEVSGVENDVAVRDRLSRPTTDQRSLTSSLTIDVEKRDEFYAITCAEMPGLLLAGKDFMVLLDDLPLAWRILRQLNDVSPDTCAFTNPPRSYESQASTVFDAHGTAQHVAPAHPSIPSGCGSGVSEGLNIGSEPSVPHAPNAIPLSEPAIRAAVYGCTDAQCVCGRCAPVRMAIDPWQGLGKTWSDK